MPRLILLGFLVAVFCVAASQAENLRPIVGILVEPAEPELKIYGKDYFICASYVKYLEMAGARVAPVLYEQLSAYLVKFLTH